MAIANVGTRGTQVSAAAGTTVARAPTAAVAAGRVLICWVAQNGNQGTTVTDAVGNTWEFIGSGSNTSGTARSDLWLCNVETQLTTANTVTVTFAGSVTHKSMALWEYSVDSGNILIESTANVPNESTGNGFGSVSFSGLPSAQRLYFRALAKQANSTGTITATSGFTSHALALRSANNASAIAQRGEYRINTSTGETSNPTWAVAGNTGNVFAAFEEYTPPAVQALEPDLFENSNAFFGHTVTAGAVALLPARLDNEQAFYAPEVTQSGGGQSLSAPLLTNAQTFYAPTVARGAVTLAPARLDNTQVFYGPTVAIGAATLLPGLLTNAQQFFAPTVTRGTVTLSAARLESAQQFFAPAVAAGPVTLAPGLLTNANAFYSPTVSAGAGALVQTSRFDSANTFFAATVARGPVTLSATRLDNAQTFYPATVAPGAVALAAPRIESANQFYAPVVSAGGSVLQPGLFVNTNTFYPAVITLGAVTLAPQRLDNGNQFFAPRITVSVKPGLFVNGSAIFAPSVAQVIGFPVGWPFVNSNLFFDATITAMQPPENDGGTAKVVLGAERGYIADNRRGAMTATRGPIQ